MSIHNQKKHLAQEWAGKIDVNILQGINEHRELNSYSCSDYIRTRWMYAVHVAIYVHVSDNLFCAIKQNVEHCSSKCSSYCNDRKHV